MEMVAQESRETDNVRYENIHDTMGRIQDTFDTFDTLYENR